MIRLTTKDIVKQLQWDLVGKDSHRGISLTYAWLANQFGHLSLGFIPALCMGAWGDMHFFGFPNTIIAGLLISVIATVFEIYNFFWPLLSKKDDMTFEPDWKNIGFDTITDLVFFYTGGLWGIQVIAHFTGETIPAGYLIALVACIIYIIGIFNYWYSLKLYIQSGCFPFQRRIAQWEQPISDESKKAIEEMIQSKAPKHLLIFGSYACKKSELAVAIGTERAIKLQPVYYSAAPRLLEQFYRSDTELRERFNMKWSWREPELLIIDNINTGTPVQDIVSPETIGKHLLNERSAENKAALNRQSVIWVLGKYDNKEEWITFVQDLGLEKEAISIVELQ